MPTRRRRKNWSVIKGDFAAAVVASNWLKPSCGAASFDVAKILPFPQSRRIAFVRRHAAIMTELSVGAAERHLANQLRIQAATLARRGFEPEIVEAEKGALDAAIRTELCRISPARGVAR